MSNNIYYRRDGAATYIRQTYFIPCSTSTLAKLACIGGGPPFKRYNRTPLYEQGDLDSWAQSKLSKKYRSTSEYENPDEPNHEEANDEAFKNAA